MPLELLLFSFFFFSSPKASGSLFCTSSGKIWDYHNSNITQILDGYEVLTYHLRILVLLRRDKCHYPYFADEKTGAKVDVFAKVNF